MKRIAICVGTRPNFIKVTQFEKSISKKDNLEYDLIHTGQHFDHQMSTIFFDELGFKEPDFYLNAKGETQMEMIGDIMVKFDQYLDKRQPDIVIVPGDVNSSLACALAASRKNIPLAHLESGLRSFDREMPEEINRILIDDLSELFFVTEQSGIDNLISEGKPAKKIHFVGNTMIDSLIAFRDKINLQTTKNDIGLEGDYALLTFHRPSNVDQQETLSKLVKLIIEISNQIHLVFSVHPRTKSRLVDFNLYEVLKRSENITLLDSLGYLDFMSLLTQAKLVLTDSGGIQEETTFLNIPCLTIRENTERPITISNGTNQLLQLDNNVILNAVNKILDSNQNSRTEIPLWDGKASERIIEIIASL